tara:strand:- start:9728 stop:16852 length:7125 start_codon:yes stop_codon:yes gene_type:complete
MIDPNKAVAWMRKNNPTLSWLSDEQLYSIAKEKYPEYDYPENPFLPDYSKTPTPNKEKDIEEFNTSPHEVNKLWSSFNLADYFSEDGIPALGLSPEMFKNASNENIVGLSHLLTTGQLKHDVGEYEPKFRESIAEFFIGLANPVDALAFFGSSGVGAFIGKPLLAKTLSKKFFQEAVEGSVRKKIVTSPSAYGVAEAFTTGTIGLGSYMAGAGALSEASKQSMEMKNPKGAFDRYGPEKFADGSVNPNPYVERNEGEWDYKSILSEGAKFGLEGMILGGITAGTGKAIGNKFFTMGGNATSKTGQTAAKLLNYPTQTAVEAGEFAFTPYLWNGMPKKEDGSVDWDQMAHDYAHSVGVIGPLKASNAFFKSSHAELKEHMAHAKKLYDMKKTYKSKEKQAFDNVKNNIEQNTEVGEKKSKSSKDVDNIIDNAINKESRTIAELLETYNEMDAFLTRTIKNFDKENLTPAELRDVLNTGPISVNLLDGWIKHLKNLEKENPTLYNELTDNGRLKVIDKITKDAEKIRDSYNEKVSQPKNAGKKITLTDKEMSPEKQVQYWENVLAEKNKNIEKAIEAGSYIEGSQEKLRLDQELGAVQVELNKAKAKIKVTNQDKLRQEKIEEADRQGVDYISTKRMKEINEILKQSDTSKEFYSVELDNFNLNDPRQAVSAMKQIKQKFEKLKQDIEYEGLSPKDKGIAKIEKALKEQAKGLEKLEKTLKEVPGTHRMRETELEILKDNRNRIIEKPKSKEEIAAKAIAEKLGMKDYDVLLDTSIINFLKKSIADKGVSTNANSLRVFFEWGKKDGRVKNFSDFNRKNIKEYFDTFIEKDKIDFAAPSAMNQYIDFLVGKQYISLDQASNLKVPIKHYHSIANELNVARKPAKEGVRRSTLEIVMDLADKGDFNSAYAGILGIEYGIRAGEIPKLRSKHIELSNQKDYFLNIKKDVKKAKTFDRVVYLEKNFAEGLKSFLQSAEKEKGFTGLKTTKISQEMRKRGLTQNEGSKSQPFYDLRKRASTIGQKTLNDQLRRQLYFMHGHGSKEYIGRIEKSYDITNVKDAINFQKQIRKALLTPGFREMQKTISPIGEFKFQREPLGQGTLDSSVKKYIQRLIKRNPGLKVAFEKDKAYAGKFLKDVIYLTEGKANLQTFFHENGHRFEAFIRDSKNKEMIQLWERGEKMFSKEAKKAGQTANEYFTDRVSDYGVGMSLGIRNKIANWSKLMMTKIKKFFFGKSNLNKRDIARLLGEKVYKGFGTENTILLGEKPKFQIKDTKKFAKTIRETFDIAMEKYIKNADKLSPEALKGEKNAMIKFIAEKSGMENPEKFTSISSSRKPEQLQKFYEYILSPEMSSLRAKTELSKFLREKDKATTLRESLNISIDKEKQILKHLGIKDGDIFNASSQQVKEYISWMDNSGLSKHVPKKDWIEDAIGEGIVTRAEVNRWALLKEVGGMTMPVQYVVKALGLKPLADKLLNHNITEMGHIGRAQKFENNIATILQTQGSKVSEAEIGVIQLARGRKKFEKIQDFLYLFDQERRIERVKNDWLSSAEQKFVNQAFEKNGLGGVKKGSIAELIKREIDTYNEYIRNELEVSVKANMNDAQFEGWKKRHNPKWVAEREGNSYVHRGLTKEFFEMYRPDSQAFEKQVEKRAHKLAKKMYKEKNPAATEAEIKRGASELLPVTEEMARAEISNSYEFSGSKFKTEFLMDRNRTKLPEKWYSNKLKKDIDVYDTSYDRVFKKYQLGMGKALANIEYFPEHVNLKGVISPDTKKSIQALERSHGKWGRYVSEIVQRQLNIGKHEGVFETTTGTLRNYANFLARTQLSFPTAGLKNALIGTYQTAFAFKLRQVAGGLLSSTDRNHRALVRRQGGTEIGLKHIDTYDGMFKGLLEKGFKFGLMRPTENLNRYVAVGASHIDQVGLLRTLKRYDSTSRKYKKAYGRLNKFYELSETEIKKLNKHGLGGVDGLKMEPVERMTLSRELNKIYSKMDAMAHIKTQGATLDLFMPYWMGSGNVKALTLFKRMAYTASVNTVENIKAAARESNPMKIAVGTMGALATGEVLMTIYDKILGQGRPAEDGPFWDKLLALLHRGEFLGIFSEWFNYNQENPFEHTISPAIYNHAYEMVKLWSDYAGDKRFLKETLDRTLRSSVSSYNSMMKVWENKMSLETVDGKVKTKDQWFNKEQKIFSKKYQEFKKLIDPDAKPTSQEYLRDVQTKYFERLKKAFNTGDEELFTRTYLAAFWSVYGDEANKGKDYLGKGTYTDKQALKRAYSRMKRYSRYLNPNKGSFIKEIFGLKSNLETKQMYVQWMQHLHPDKQFKDFKMVNGKVVPFIGPNTSENQARLIKAETEFWFRYRKMFDKNGMLKKELIKKYFGKDAMIN